METCSQCGKEPIINKKYKLGPRCNSLRLNPNVEEERKEKYAAMIDRQREKAVKKREEQLKNPTAIVKLKSKRINGLSKKEAERKKLLHQTYADMDESVERVCAGCGRGDVPLSHSHIISRHFGKRFEADPRNIVYDCLSMGGRTGCHDIWEHGTWKDKMKLLNYRERMDYVCEVSTDLWHRMKNREDEVTSPSQIHEQV